MKRSMAIGATLAGLLTILALSSCAHTPVHYPLADYSFLDATLAADMILPPEPTINVFYHVTFDPDDPLRTALSIGTSVLKAAEVEQAQERMRQALETVDVPELLRDQALAGCSAALGTRNAGSVQEADYRLVLDIHEYGISARGYGSGVAMTMEVTAGLYSNLDRKLIWRRNVSLDVPATVQLFGVGHVVGNLVTAAMLADLSTEELAAGFRNLATEAARSLAHRLERDLDAAYGL